MTMQLMNLLCVTNMAHRAFSLGRNNFTYLQNILYNKQIQTDGRSLRLRSERVNEYIKYSNLNPFQQEKKIIICSYHCAKSKSPYIKQEKWDLAVIDEAHRNE